MQKKTLADVLTTANALL